jgi:pimeloyl-ACP methyl ester carboxylesterase
MTPLAPNARDHEWQAYYARFPSCSPEAVRDGCYPRVMAHESPTGKAIVLVHGLCDSPYFMAAIGEYFFHHLGYDVYLPLLHGHALREPHGMEDVDLDQWKANVNFAVETAAARADDVAIGGFSTGGTLGFYTAVTNPAITGPLYLFSAALDLAGGMVGEVKELALRFPGLVNLVERFEPDTSLIGPNPYRYAHVDKDGARELAKLMQETDALTRAFNQKNLFSKRVFAAHSEADETADIAGIDALQAVSAPGRFMVFRIPRAAHVSHASLVLNKPMAVIDGSSGAIRIDVEANPRFQAMMEAIAAWEQ